MSRSIKCAGGRRREFRVWLGRPFEPGTTLVGDSFVLFIVRPNHVDLYAAGQRAIMGLR